MVHAQMLHYFSSVKIHNGKFTLTGYSRAGDATSIYIPELGFMLDAGLATEQKPSKVFVTHCHSDHSFQLPTMYNRLALLDVFVPMESESLFYSYLKSAQNLNDGTENHTREKFLLRPVVAGQAIDVTNLYRVRIMQCFHKVPSVGYAFYEKRKKLKAEFNSLTGFEVAEIRKSGVAVTEETEVPLFAFLGDTTPKVFDVHPELFEMPHVIVECTFLEGTQTDAKGHSYWEGLRPHIAQHPNTTFILIHFSSSLDKSEIIDFFAKESLPNVIPFV